jgi:hypothetical protein
MSLCRTTLRVALRQIIIKTTFQPSRQVVAEKTLQVYVTPTTRRVVLQLPKASKATFQLDRRAVIDKINTKIYETY